MTEIDLETMLANMRPKRASRTSRTTPERAHATGSTTTMPWDPIARAREVEAMVMKGAKRLYDSDKFRYQRFYGGIATAGSRGCNLRCLYCFNFARNEDPRGAGTFYSPREVRERLENIASRHDTGLARISGSENFLGEASARHLYEVIANSDLDFVTETNGIILGAMPRLLEKFKKLRNFRLRLSFKAPNALQFEKLTGSDSWGYVYQLQAIREIQARHIPLKVAYMPQFVDPNQIDVSGYALEEENMTYYPGVKDRLRIAGIKPKA